VGQGTQRPSKSAQNGQRRARKSCRRPANRWPSWGLGTTKKERKTKAPAPTPPTLSNLQEQRFPTVLATVIERRAPTVRVCGRGSRGRARGANRGHREILDGMAVRAHRGRAHRERQRATRSPGARGSARMTKGRTDGRVERLVAASGTSRPRAVGSRPAAAEVLRTTHFPPCVSRAAPRGV